MVPKNSQKKRSKIQKTPKNEQNHFQGCPFQTFHSNGTFAHHYISARFQKCFFYLPNFVTVTDGPEVRTSNLQNCCQIRTVADGPKVWYIGSKMTILPFCEWPKWPFLSKTPQTSGSKMCHWNGKSESLFPTWQRCYIRTKARENSFPKNNLFFWRFWSKFGTMKISLLTQKTAKQLRLGKK